jgi:hypothetical protein
MKLNAYYLIQTVCRTWHTHTPISHCHVCVCWLYTGFGLNIQRGYMLHIIVHSHVFISSCSLAASNDGRSLSSALPNYPQPLLPLLSLTDSPTHSTPFNWLTNFPVNNIAARIAQKTSFLVEVCVLLHSNGRYLVISRSLPNNESTCHNIFVLIQA